jgi:GT2 family glycosyltransferase
MSFAIGIPTLNRGFDLLLPSLIKYTTGDFKDIDIHIVDNGKQNLKFFSDLAPKTHIYEQQYNLGVAASWNMLCNKIFETHSHALILNDDVYLGYDTQRVNDIISKYPYSLVQSHISWSVILISKHMYDYIGAFDETFYPAYYEDSDYLYRMKLKGIIQDVDESLNPKTIRISMTQEKDPELVNESMRVNRERYIEKWGNSPLLETYLTPYNK